MPRCVAPGCRNTDAAHLGMFSFPKDSVLNLKWRTNMRRAKSVKEPWKLWSGATSSRLCGAHFEDECFVPPSPNFAKSIGFTPKSFNLKKGAIPTLFEKPTTPAREPKTTTSKPRGAFEKRRRKEAIKELLDEHVDASDVAPDVTPEVSNSEAANRDESSTEATPEVIYQEPVETPPIPTSQSVLSDITNVRPQKKFVQKKIQTPKWKTSVRSFAIQAKPTMVDQGTQYNIADTGEPQPVPETPSTSTQLEDDLNQSFLSDSTMEIDDDEDDDDPDYEPDFDMEVSDNEESMSRTELEDGGDPKTERKYIVFESALKDLFKTCMYCGYSCSVYRSLTKGTLVEIESVCNSDSSHRRLWRNQPSHHRLPLGNLLLSAAILFSGSSPVKMINALKFLRIEVFCLRTFFQIQTCYLIPAVDNVLRDEREVILRDINGPVSVGGDARCCSPGHTAKYGSYTLMDLSTNKILEMQLIQSNEVTSSNAMELEGLKRCLEKLTEDQITVSDITTDRHPSVKKFVREKHPEVRHWFDVWHVAKGVKKKIEAVSKRKGCQMLSDWSQSISNHMYYCAAESKGNGELLKQMWCSILNHVVDIHEGHGPLYPKCGHEQLDDRAWIKKESKPHKELRDVINRQHLLKDIQKLSHAEQTYGLEAFHKVCCHFATKFVHFFYHSMECRLKLACLHYNENSNRAQNTNKAGELMWQIAVPKFKKGQPVAKPVKVAATYDYVDKLIDEVLERRESLPTYKASRAELQPVLAKTPKPVSSKYGQYNKEEIVSAHKSRFKLLD